MTIWPEGILSRVSREAYDATTRARGFDFMTPEEREAAAVSYDELTGRSPSHDDAFAAFQERKRAAEAATIKVTWRRAIWSDGTGYSGLGPNRQLVYALQLAPLHGRTDWEYGRVIDGKRVRAGQTTLLMTAKHDAEQLFGQDSQ